MSDSSAILAVQEGPSGLFSLLPYFRDQMNAILKGAKWLAQVLMLSRQTLPPAPESPPQPLSTLSGHSLASPCVTFPCSL